jgi:hypothetical protein
MKTKYTKILRIAIITFIFAGCTDEFLDTKLKNNLGVDSFYETKDHAIQAVTSSYDPLKQRGLFSVNYQYVMYALSDRLINENSALNEYAFNANNSSIGGDKYNWSIWDVLYRGIFRVNLAIEKIPAIEFANDEEEPVGYPLKERLIAEARFLRAIYNFYLVVHFNEPVFLDYPVYDMNADYTNSPQEVFWNSIEEDLLFAIDNLPLEYSNKNKGRATQGAAMAMLGKAYLYQQNWEEAEEYFKMVIDSDQYELIMPQSNDSTDYVYAYLANFSYRDITSKSGNVYRAELNRESIFEVSNKYSTENIINEWNAGMQTDGSLFSVYYGTLGFKNVVPTAEMADQIYEKTPDNHTLSKDPRFYASIYSDGDTVATWNTLHKHYNTPFNFIIHTNTGITEEYGLKKYVYPAHYREEYGYFNDPNNWRLIRYADVLLMYAEACYHTKNTAQGLDALNQVRRRAGLSDVDALTPEVIMHERDVELFAECVRYLDLVRWLKLPNPWVKASDIHPNFIKGKHEYFPIPEVDVLRLQGSLKQNPGW